jgi:hypothetical protein
MTAIDLCTHRAATKLNIYFNALRPEAEVGQQSVTKIIYLVHINLVTPKARAKHEPFVQQTGLSLLNKSYCLAAALGGTEFVTIMGYILLY